jgi:hypothetical protein
MHSLMVGVLASNKRQLHVVNSQLVGLEQDHRKGHERLSRMIGYLESLNVKWYVQGSPTRQWYNTFASINGLVVFRLAREV